MKIGGTTLTLTQGDITTEHVDALVNAANSSLMGGGGVDGAIHRVGGPQILEECKKIREQQGRCATGQAVLTTAGKLPAKYVVHTVGPVWSGGTKQEAGALRNCYLKSLELAESVNARSIAFPSISTGAYGYPTHEAAQVALKAIHDYLQTSDHFDEIRIVLFSEEDYRTYMKAARQM